MGKKGLGKILDALGNRKTDVLRLHSRARGLLKKARKRLSHGQSLRFHRAFVQEGDLVFDIGANVGDMTALYLELGARVISVEPQEECLKRLDVRFGRHPLVNIVPMAVGAVEGEQEMLLSDIRSPLSSMSPEWIAAVKSSGRFPYYAWGRSVTVPVTTLDSLIALHGEPAFCKIDVEGFEKEVLKGLSRPLSLLSFEFHAEFIGETLACLGRLRELGLYSFNFTQENRPVFESTKVLNEKEISQRLLSLPFSSLQGDVYAFREEQAC
jgi:FkbM family methyltransferase